nr:molybdate ABC transporter permease subunit [Devosia pacifica]
MLAELWPPIALTLALSAATTLCLLVIGTWLALWLSETRWKGRHIIGAIVALPLVLPPTVLGFYLLIALGPSGPGGMLAGLWGGRTLAFSFPGLLIGSILYSLPFMVHPLRTAFEALPREHAEVAYLFGASRWQRFWWIIVPLSRSGYLTGLVLTFAHTIGEFGVVLMIGGNIPGRTKVLSIAIYDYVERLEWQSAHIVSLGLVVFGLVAVTAMLMVDRGGAHRNL